MRRHGELESTVLHYLSLRRAPAYVRDVHSALQMERPLAYTTVMTVLDRLSRKGLVDRRKEGRAWIYETKAPEPSSSGTLTDPTQQQGQHVAVMMDFIQKLSDDEVAEVRGMLDRRSGGVT